MRVLLITDRHVMAAQHGDFASALRAALPPYRAHSWRDQVVLLLRDKDASEAERAELLTIACNAVPAEVPIMVSSFVPAGISAADHARIAGLHAPEAVPLSTVQRDVAAWQRPALVGCSRHNTAGVMSAAYEGARYVQYGPLWPTPSKAGMGEPLGVAGLLATRAALAAAGATCSLVAVGGITDGARASQAVTAGADAVAVIRAVWASPAPADQLAHLLHSMAAARAT